MKEPAASCRVLADVSDPSWSGQLDLGQLSDPLCCYTDIFLGKVQYWTVGSDVNQPFGNPSYRDGIFGHFNEFARALLQRSTGVVKSIANGWSMEVSVHYPSVSLREDPDLDPIEVDYRSLCTAVADAIESTVKFARATRGGQDLPGLVKDVEILAQRLRET